MRNRGTPELTLESISPLSLYFRPAIARVFAVAQRQAHFPATSRCGAIALLAPARMDAPSHHSALRTYHFPRSLALWFYYNPIKRIVYYNRAKFRKNTVWEAPKAFSVKNP